MSRSKDRDVYLRFFPSDWRSDEALRGCSLAARGLWIELMCLAHRHAGHVKVNGGTPGLSVLARQVVSTPTEVRRLLAELLENGVASRSEDGTIYSRRMVRDAKRREINRANGEQGGNPGITKTPRKQEKSDNRNGTDGLSASDKTHIQSPDPDPKSRSRSKPLATNALFERFWKAYPRKVKKPKAAAIFAKLNVDDALMARMLESLDWQRAQPEWQRQGGKFVPHPTSWLEARRWEDEPFETPADSSLSANDDVWAATEAMRQSRSES